MAPVRPARWPPAGFLGRLRFRKAVDEVRPTIAVNETPRGHDCYTPQSRSPARCKAQWCKHLRATGYESSGQVTGADSLELLGPIGARFGRGVGPLAGFSHHGPGRPVLYLIQRGTAQPNVRTRRLTTMLESRAAQQEDPGDIDVVMYIDLDKLKKVNDSHGHGAGDRALIAVSRRLRAALPAPHFVGRAGGDEFVAVLIGVDEEDMENVSDDIHLLLLDPIEINGEEFRIRTSVGIVRIRDGEKRLRRTSSVMQTRRCIRPNSAAEAIRSGTTGPTRAVNPRRPQ